MNHSEVIERIYEHLENDHVEKAVMACLRLARNTQDYLNTAIFLRELYPDKQLFSKIFYEDTAKLNKETQAFLWTTSLDMWIASRVIPFKLDVEEEGEKVLALGAGQLDSDMVQTEKTIQDLMLPPGMAPFDVAAFTDRNANIKAGLRQRINAIQTLRHRIKTRCLNYAISMERQLEAQEKPELFLHEVQREVNNYFKARSEEVYLKLQKAAQLVGSEQQEDSSLLLTSVRRAIKAVADHFLPPTAGAVLCSDGTSRVLGDDQYLNRLKEFLVRNLPSGSSTKLLNAELDLFITRLNSLSSKGVHANATEVEAKQGLVGLYLLLYNIVTKLQNPSPP